MGQFMGKELSAFHGRGRKFIGGENDMRPDGVGARVHLPRRLRGFAVRMHAHAAEVVAEAPFHILPQRRLQRLAWPGDDPVDGGGRVRRAFSRVARAFAAKGFLLLFAFGAFALDAEGRRDGDRADGPARGDRIGHSIGLALQWIVDAADSELRLKRLRVKMRPDRLGLLSGSRLGWIERVTAGAHGRRRAL